MCYIITENWLEAEKTISLFIKNNKNNSISYQLRSLSRRKQGKYLLAYNDLIEAEKLNPANFENRVKKFQTSMQMIDYEQSVLDLLNIFDYINKQPEYIDNYIKVLFYPNLKETILICLPYYTYLDNLTKHKKYMISDQQEIKY